MTKLFLIVKAEVEESIEDQWNEWYNTIHVPEVMACPGFCQPVVYYPLINQPISRSMNWKVRLRSILMNLGLCLDGVFFLKA